jgi:hypothetical protein
VNSSRFLCGFVLAFDGCDSLGDVLDADLPGVNLVERRMLLDRLVQQRLGDGGIVHFAVAVAPVADQVDDHVGAELVAILGGDAGDAHHGIDVFTIDVKDGNRLPPRQLRGETRGVLFAGIGGEPDQVVDDHVDGSADGVAGEVGIIQRLRGDALPGERGVAVHQHGRYFALPPSPARSCLARVRPTVTGSTASRWLGFEARWI